MTDNEIIKALECLRGNAFDCGECPYCSCYPAPCEQQVAKDALSLINRQKEEIERLKNRDLQVEVSEKLEREIKAEAVKEFAERLKEQDGYDNHVFDDCASILVPKEYLKGRDEKIKEVWTTIDNLVKEMERKNNA